MMNFDDKTGSICSCYIWDFCWNRSQISVSIVGKRSLKRLLLQSNWSWLMLASLLVAGFLSRLQHMTAKLGKGLEQGLSALWSGASAPGPLSFLACRAVSFCRSSWCQHTCPCIPGKPRKEPWLRNWSHFFVWHFAFVANIQDIFSSRPR